MANKNSATNTILNKVDKIKVQAKKVNEGVLKTSDKLVEESLATGKQWQKIMAKVLQNGTVLFGKQQDLFLTTVKTVKNQYDSGNQRVQQLLGIEETVDVTIKKAKATVKAAVAEVKALTEKPSKDAKTKKVVAKTKQVKKAQAKVKPVRTKKVKAKKVKSTKPAASTVVVKSSPKKKVTITTPVSNDNLTLITGIGPKLASILNNAGIHTFKVLAATDLKTLNNILETAGTRYSKFDPKPWLKQAKLAASGKLK